MPTLFAPLETKVNPWLTLRFGGRRACSTRTSTRTTTPIHGDAYTGIGEGSPLAVPMLLGAGVKLGTLQFDATLAQDFFHNPATYVTGSPTARTTTRRCSRRSPRPTRSDRGCSPRHEGGAFRRPPRRIPGRRPARPGPGASRSSPLSRRRRRRVRFPRDLAQPAAPHGVTPATLAFPVDKVLTSPSFASGSLPEAVRANRMALS